MLVFVGKINDAITHRRKPWKMSNTNSKGNAESTQRKRGRIREFLDRNGGLVAAIVGIFTAISLIAAAVFYVVSNTISHENGIEKLNEKIANIEGNYDEMHNEIRDFSELFKEDHKILVNLAANSKSEPVYNVEVLSSDFARTELINEEDFLSELNLDVSHIFAKDWNGSITYTVEDFYNTPIITSYKENNNDVYFYGRYNENGNWNGTCILNTYNGDNLVSIFEGVYQDGNLFSYKRVSSEKDGEWLITDRIALEDRNIGKTWSYAKTNDFTKEFDYESVKEKQILTVDNFLQSINGKLLSYYDGSTSNGLYNDETGNSYFVKYKDDGDVQFLYVGKMKNGQPNDNTGNAWSIMWGNEDDGYYYYKGTFKDGKHGKAPENWEPMTQEEINEKINIDNFNCPLTGLVSGDV